MITELELPKNFSELPFSATVRDYELVVGGLLQEWTSSDSLPLAIYQIGEIGAPGVSDLDFIVVFDDGHSGIPFGRYEPAWFPEKTRAYFTHSVYFATRESWQSLAGCLPLFSLKLLWGNELPPQSFDARYLPGLAAANLVNYLTVKMPLDILTQIWSDSLKVRTVLCMLNSLKYILRMVQEAGLEIGCHKEGIALCNRVQALRIGWQEDKQSYNELETLIHLVLPFIGSVTHDVGEEIVLLSNGHEREGRIRMNGCVCLLTRNWKMDESVRTAAKYFRNRAEHCWSVPASFGIIFAQYAASNHAFGSYLRRGGFRAVNQTGIDRWSDGLSLFADSAVAYQECMHRHGFVPIKYVGLGYSKPLSLLTRVCGRFKRTFGNSF